MFAPTETDHAVAQTGIVLHHLRRFRATIVAFSLAIAIPLSLPLWIVGAALFGAVALDGGLWWARRRVKGLLSPELANAALDLLPAVFFVLDRRGGLQYWNARFADLVGPEGDDLNGLRLYHFFGGENRQNVIVAVTQALTRGMSTVEVEFTTEGGQNMPVLLTAIRVNLGGTYRLIGVGLDISARKEAEAKLRRRERQYRLLAENVTDVVTHMSPAANLLYVSPSVKNLLGHPPEELKGERALDLVHPEDRERCKRVVREALAEGRRPRVEFRVQTKDEGYLWVESVGKTLEGSGDRQELVISTRDISERKAREAELDTVEAARREAERARKEAERANRLKSNFLANMSHEIRTPLTSILGFAEAIGEEVEELEERLERPDLGALSRFVHLIEKGGRRLLGTLDGVLNLSKLEAGEVELSPEPVDLTEEPKEVAALFEPQAEEASLDIRPVVEDAPVWATVDPDGLRIVLRNLVSNAVKYTEENGQVWIRAREGEDAAVLEVEDTGIGMDPEKVSELFEAFRQGSEGMSREYEGSGLGLAVTSQMVAQMGGTIEVETEKGEGCCFTVRLPRRRERRQNGRRRVRRQRAV